MNYSMAVNESAYFDMTKLIFGYHKCAFITNFPDDCFEIYRLFVTLHPEFNLEIKDEAFDANNNRLRLYRTRALIWGGHVPSIIDIPKHFVYLKDIDTLMWQFLTDRKWFVCNFELHGSFSAQGDSLATLRNLLDQHPEWKLRLSPLGYHFMWSCDNTSVIEVTSRSVFNRWSLLRTDPTMHSCPLPVEIQTLFGCDASGQPISKESQ